MGNTLNEVISLHGEWGFKLDEENKGIEEKWYEQALDDSLILPGTLQMQGFGNEITKDTEFVHGLHDTLWFLREEYKEFAERDKVIVPFLSQPVRHYTGAAWYQKEIYIPEEWADKHVLLKLELTRWKTTVWVDDNCCGDCDSLCVPHEYELGRLAPGTHVVTIRVDNSMLYPYRPDAHGVSDSVGHSWNGIAGKIELIPKNCVWVENVQVYPDYKTKSAAVKLNIRNIAGKPQNCNITIKKHININTSEALVKETEAFSADISGEEKVYEFILHMGEEASLWDEFTPVLHRLEIVLGDSVQNMLYDAREVTFGLRNISTDKRKFVLNGRNICFRGTHDAGCFPLTGYPSTDLKEWRHIMSVCRSWGLNHIRYHSWCPPEAAFIAADELGMYLQIETGMWNHFTLGGDIERQLYVETDRILKAFGNHPSFVLMSSGNEPHGNYKPVVTAWVAKYRKEDNRHLYCVQSGWGWPTKPEELHVTDYLYTCSRSGGSRMRGKHGWFGKDYSEYVSDLEVPFISHELGQYCSYPDFSIMDKFTGYLQPGNYEIIKEIARKHKLLHKNSDFVKASGILQTLAYKEEVEANLRTPEYSGFSLLDLHDYLGQGSALIGLLDAFWEEKPYSDAKQFRRFCADTVPLTRIKKATYKVDELLDAGIEISCYAASDINNATVYWRLEDADGTIYKSGIFEGCTIKTGGNTHIGRIIIKLDGLKTPSVYKFVVGISDTDVENDNKLWIYPAEPDFSVFKTVKITEKLEEAVTYLKNGEKVLFLPRFEDISHNSPPLSMLPIFWNGHMGPKWSRGLGIWCDTKHPALADFPTDCGMEWQWKEIVENARGLNIESLPEELEPFVWPIDDWNRSYKLAMAFEAKAYNGKLVVCSADLKNNLENRPAARQLLYSILSYMESDSFAPAVEVMKEHLNSFMFNTTIMKDLGVRVRVTEGCGDGDNIKFPIENIIDCNPNTYWLSGGRDGGRYPFEIEFSVEQSIEAEGLYVMPRQNHRDAEGAVKNYEVYASMDGTDREKICNGEFKASFDLQKIDFGRKVKLNKLYLRLLEGFGAEDVWYCARDKGFYMKRGTYKDGCASLAEVMFICDESVKASDAGDTKIVYKDVGTASEEIY